MRQESLNQLLERGERLLRRGQSSNALATFHQALRISTRDDWQWEVAHFRLAEIHLILGDELSAVEHLKHAAKRSGEEPKYAYMLGQILRRLGHSEEALGYLMIASGAPRFRLGAMIELAYANADLGHRGVARVLVDSVARQSSDHPDLKAVLKYTADA